LGKEKAMSFDIEVLQDRKRTELAQFLVCNKPVLITSSYKGIILTQPVLVLKVTPERIIIQAPGPTLSFTLKERVHLYSLAFHEILSARVLNLNAITGKLELAGLTFSGRYWNERQYDRVQPRDPIYVYVEHKKALVRANLDNLSVGGMSLMACTDNEKALHTDHDSALRLTLQMPGENAPFNLKGKVVHVRQTGRLVIVGVQLIDNSAQEKHINDYVMARKTEILVELERTYQDVCERHLMLDLYN
jgi:hypothetical protein